MSHPRIRRVLAHARWETQLTLRNGEQVLLTIIIPVAMLLGLGLLQLWPVTGERVPTAVAAVWVVTVLATCFTSLAIGTGFERRSGALRFLSTTPLTRLELLAGKVLAVLASTALSIAIVSVVAVAIGWRPGWTVLPALGVLALGGAALGTWAFVLAGTLRAEAVLAVANGIFIVLLLAGGVAIPPDRLPGALAGLAQVLPTGALTDALTSLLVDASAPGAWPIVVLVAWLVAGAALARRFFRWN